MSSQVNPIAQSVVEQRDLEILTTLAWDLSVSLSSKGTIDGLEGSLMVSREKLPTIADHDTHHCPVAPISIFHPRPLNVHKGPGGRQLGSVESSGLSLKGGSIGRWQLSYRAVLSCLCQRQAILFCFCLRDKVQAPGLLKAVTQNHKKLCRGKRHCASFPYGSDC